MSWCHFSVHTLTEHCVVTLVKCNVTIRWQHVWSQLFQVVCSAPPAYIINMCQVMTYQTDFLFWLGLDAENVSRSVTGRNNSFPYRLNGGWADHDLCWNGVCSKQNEWINVSLRALSICLFAQHIHGTNSVTPFKHIKGKKKKYTVFLNTTIKHGWGVRTCPLTGPQCRCTCSAREWLQPGPRSLTAHAWARKCVLEWLLWASRERLCCWTQLLF